MAVERRLPDRGGGFAGGAALACAVLILGCGGPVGGGGGEPTPATGVSVRVYPAAHPPERRSVTEEAVPQDNCNGQSAVQYVHTLSRSISHTIQIDSEVSLSASGVASLPGFGQVQVGGAVAAHYGVTYGEAVSVSRSLTLQAPEGTRLVHNLRTFELWDAGEIEVATGLTRRRFPYRLRRDFVLEFVSSRGLGCPNRTVAGRYGLGRWTEGAGPHTLGIDAFDGTLSVAPDGSAYWDLTIQQRGEPLPQNPALQPRVRCRGVYSPATGRLTGTGPNAEVNWPPDTIGAVRNDVFLAFCGRTATGADDPFTLAVTASAGGEKRLEMRNGRGTYTWQGH